MKLPIVFHKQSKIYITRDKESDITRDKESGLRFRWCLKS
jgi:hypothetical protein